MLQGNSFRLFNSSKAAEQAVYLSRQFIFNLLPNHFFLSVYDIHVGLLVECAQILD